MANVAKILPFLASVLLLGCGESGPPLGKVTGTVTLDGQPLPYARVEFQPTAGGSPSYANTDAGGKFELVYGVEQKGALIGEHKVSITSYRQERSADGVITEVPERVPPNYNLKTELTKNVEAGSQVIDFALTGALDGSGG